MYWYRHQLVILHYYCLAFFISLFQILQVTIDRKQDEKEEGWHAAKGHRSDLNPGSTVSRMSLRTWAACPITDQGAQTCQALFTAQTYLKSLLYHCGAKVIHSKMLFHELAYFFIYINQNALHSCPTLFFLVQWHIIHMELLKIYVNE